MGNKSNKENKTKEIFNKIVDGVTSIIDSGEYAKFLKFSRNFHNYSFNNIVLIFSQMEEATQVAGFKAWKNMGRNGAINRFLSRSYGYIFRILWMEKVKKVLSTNYLFSLWMRKITAFFIL